jgi:hypothetical protein
VLLIRGALGIQHSYFERGVFGLILIEYAIYLLVLFTFNSNFIDPNDIMMLMNHSCSGLDHDHIVDSLAVVVLRDGLDRILLPRDCKMRALI